MKLSKQKYGVGNIACEKCGGWDDGETYEDPDFGLWGECQKCKTKYKVEVDVHTETSGCPTEIYTGDELTGFEPCNECDRQDACSDFGCWKK